MITKNPPNFSSRFRSARSFAHALRVSALRAANAATMQVEHFRDSVVSLVVKTAVTAIAGA
jgi:hypothetical protein